MSLDEKTCFPPLNDNNYMEWFIHMEVELIHKGLWDNVQCEVSVEEKQLKRWRSQSGGNIPKRRWWRPVLRLF
jgi:hypothetical protein